MTIAIASADFATGNAGGMATGGTSLSARPALPGRHWRALGMAVTPPRRQQKAGRARWGGSSHLKNHQLHFPVGQNKHEGNSTFHCALGLHLRPPGPATPGGSPRLPSPS